MQSQHSGGAARRVGVARRRLAEAVQSGAAQLGQGSAGGGAAPAAAGDAGGARLDTAPLPLFRLSKQGCHQRQHGIWWQRVVKSCSADLPHDCRGGNGTALEHCCRGASVFRRTQLPAPATAHERVGDGPMCTVQLLCGKGGQHTPPGSLTHCRTRHEGLTARGQGAAGWAEGSQFTHAPPATPYQSFSESLRRGGGHDVHRNAAAAVQRVPVRRCPISESPCPRHCAGSVAQLGQESQPSFMLGRHTRVSSGHAQAEQRACPRPLGCVVARLPQLLLSPALSQGDGMGLLRRRLGISFKVKRASGARGRRGPPGQDGQRQRALRGRQGTQQVGQGWDELACDEVHALGVLQLIQQDANAARRCTLHFSACRPQGLHCCAECRGVAGRGCCHRSGSWSAVASRLACFLVEGRDGLRDAADEVPYGPLMRQASLWTRLVSQPPQPWNARGNRGGDRLGTCCRKTTLFT